MKYAVICYAEHNNEIESIDVFDKRIDALNQMERDFSLKLDDEETSTPEDEIDNLYSDITKEDAGITSYDGEMSWIWKIIECSDNDVEKAEYIFMASLK